jgi:hypothetical protein
LTIRSYTIEKNGLEYATQISPTLTSYQDSLSNGDGSVGASISYRIKALNEAGESVYSEALNIIVGTVPNAPQNLVKLEHPAADKVKITWEEGIELIDNPPILAYRVYLDDGSGNDPVKVYDTGHRSLTNFVTINDLIIGHVYRITVTAINVIGESLASNELEIEAGIAPT